MLRRRDVLTLGAVALVPRLGRSAAVRSRTVREVLGTIPHVDGAGVQLQKVIGQQALRHLDPFVMLDRFHSNNPRDYEAGFPDHPHRGFETVTIMLSGHMLHRDSRGNAGDITGGGAQWMTAGRGIVHSEMPRQDVGWMSGFQLWVNLPAKEKMRAPEYQDLAPSAIAHGKLSSAGSVMNVIAGEVNGLKGPVHPRPTEPLLATVVLEDDRALSIAVPEKHSAFVFVSEGVLHIGETAVPAGRIAVLAPGNRIVAQARSERSTVLVAAGKPIGEPIVQHGPFVMNTEDEIRKAFADYHAGTLGQ